MQPLDINVFEIVKESHYFYGNNILIKRKRMKYEEMKCLFDNILS